MTTTRQLKYANFEYDGKVMKIMTYGQRPGEKGWDSLYINRVYLLSLMRFGLRCLTKRTRMPLSKRLLKKIHNKEVSKNV